MKIKYVQNQMPTQFNNFWEIIHVATVAYLGIHISMKYQYENITSEINIRFLSPLLTYSHSLSSLYFWSHQVEARLLSHISQWQYIHDVIPHFHCFHSTKENDVWSRYIHILIIYGYMSSKVRLSWQNPPLRWLRNWFETQYMVLKSTAI